MSRHPASASPAFTLIEMAIVLVIAGLLMVMVLGATTGLLGNQKRQNVRARLDAIETAMTNFVAVNRRLPCPADGRLASSAPGAGVEALVPATGACQAAVLAHGVVPWVTLGITESDAQDPWNARLTYRLDPALAGAAPLPLLMNMSNCDPASSGATGAGGICKLPAASCTGNANCTSPAAFLAGKGLDVWTCMNGANGWSARPNNSTTGSGAAWVITSHGPGGNSAYNSAGILQPGTVPLSKDLEDKNANGTLLTAKPPTQANAYCDAPLNENEALLVQTIPPPPAPAPPPRTQLHFDDYLSHPTLMSVLNRANLGPRPH